MSKKPAPLDWHKADIKAALQKAGWSLRQLSFKNGYQVPALHIALHQPYPKAERIVADALGLHPMAIWPSRYEPGTGRPLSRRGERGRGRHPCARKPQGHDSSRFAGCNVELKGAR